MKRILKKHAATFAALVCLLGGAAFVDSAPAPDVDTVYYGGKIYTMTDLLNDQEKFDFSKLKGLSPDSAKTTEVVAVKGGKITFLGDEGTAKAGGYLDVAADKKVDLQGHVMLPGLVDGHGHFPTQGMYDLYEVNLNSQPLGPVATQQDILDAIGAKCRSASAGEWVLGWNYDDSLIQPAGHPQKDAIDTVCPGNPVWLRHISGHMGVVNSKALALARTNDPTNYAQLVGTGNVNETTGLMLETQAQSLVMTEPTFPENASNPDRYDDQKSLARASQVYVAAGITTADDGGHVAFLHLPLFQEGLVRNAVKPRVVFHPSGFTQAVPTMDIDSGGFLNRATFGWTNNGGSLGNPTLDFYGNGSNATPTGSDITQFKAKVVSGGSLVDGTLPAGLDSNFKNRIFLGAYKLFSDGSPQGYSALMKRPGYYDWGDHTAAESYDAASQGEPKYLASLSAGNTSSENMKKVIALYHKYGVSTETHTNGNLGAEEWMAAMEAAVSDPANSGVSDTRHTSIHAQFMELQQVQRMTGNYAAAEKAIAADTAEKTYTNLLGAFEDRGYKAANVNGLDMAILSERMKAQNLFNSYYVNHTWWWGKRHYEIFQGPGRANNMSPVGWSLEYNQPYSFHNDTFVLPIDQLRSVQSGVTRATAASPVDAGGQVISGTGHDINATVTLPARKANGATLAGSEMIFPNYDHRINSLQALLAVTAMPAWQNKLEDKIGSIREGLLADFVILDQDPLKVDPMRIAAIRVTSTIVGGEPVYGFLPGAKTFAAVPVASYYQPDAVQVRNVAATAYDNEEADKIHALRKDETRYGTYDIDADITPNGEVGVFQMDLLGNNAPAKAFRLYSVANPNAPSAFAYAHDMADGGNFWIAPLSDPQKALGPDDVLSMNKAYVLFYTMKDGGKYDEARIRAGADGKITGSVALVTSGSLPTNRSGAGNSGAVGGGDSGGGCTIGATPSYDLLILLLALAGVAVLRSLRRRNML